MRALLLALLGVLTLSGAGVAQQRGASHDALGSATEFGLVVVEVELVASKTQRILGGGGARRVRGRLVWLGDVPRSIEAAESNDLIVFSGLRPGPYRLAAITATMGRGNASRPLQARLAGDDPRFTVDVKAGVPTYLGKVTVIDGDGPFRVGKPLEPTSTVENSTVLAEEAWRRFLVVHDRTAWAQRLREHLADEGAAAAAAPGAGAPATLTPLERVEALLQEADAAEQHKATRYFLEQKRSAIASAERDIASYVESHPDDARAMLMGIRLAWLRESRTPIVLQFSAGQDVVAPDDAFARLETTADRVIALEPGNAEAHSWKAVIAAVELPAVKDGVLVRIPRDLPQAVASAKQAVELEPTNARYRDALATFLVMDDRPDEALETIRPVVDASGAPHPITSIFAAWQALPLPGNVQEEPRLARGFTYLQVDEGRITSYPGMRVRAYTVPVRKTEVEAFYKAHWKGFRLFELSSERDGATRMTLYGQFLTWREGRLELATSKRQVENAPDGAGEGLILIFTEYVGVSLEDRPRFEGATSGTFMELTFVNVVSMRDH